MKNSMHWITQNLYQKALLATTASLLIIGIIEHDITFTLEHWIAWLFFSAALLATLTLAPKFVHPRNPTKTSSAKRHLGNLLFTILTLLACWWLGLNIIQGVAFCISFAILLLAMEINARTDMQNREITKTPHQAITVTETKANQSAVKAEVVHNEKAHQ